MWMIIHTVLNSPNPVLVKNSKFLGLPESSKVGLKSTMDNMDDHPSSSIGLEGVWMVIHGSSRGPWMVAWAV